ncbi:MAG: putative sulfate exporter family transporter, partial [Microlunatus sp.]|nr:putative sulfate exporter family transporter [Microlunatus sp.]
EDGHFVMVDRPTHLIMRGGLAVYRRAVEEALLTHPGISEAKVVAVPHTRHGEEVHTVIERDPRAVVSEAELLQWAREQLPGLTGTEMELATVPADASRIERISSVTRQLLPGVAFAAAGTAVAFAVNLVVPFLSPLTAGVLLGVVLANLGWVPTQVRPGLAVSTRRLLRAGVVFLGLQLSLVELAGLGVPLLVVVVVTVVFGFLATRWIGVRLGVSRNLSLLTASGFSICGASAIAAMEGASDADEDEVATAIALVTIFGTIAMFGWPLLQPLLGLGDEAYGAWSGASVHEVAQVVAAASPAGAAALATAVVVKLARVIMLAPLVAVVAYLARRRSHAERDPSGRRPPLVPLFVLGFLAMVVLRTTGVVPQNVLDVTKILTTALLAAALFGLGTGVRVRVLLSTGPRALALGAISTVVLAAVAYAGVLLAVGAG